MVRSCIWALLLAAAFQLDLQQHWHPSSYHDYWAQSLSHCFSSLVPRKSSSGTERPVGSGSRSRGSTQCRSSNSRVCPHPSLYPQLRGPSPGSREEVSLFLSLGWRSRVEWGGASGRRTSGTSRSIFCRLIVYYILWLLRNLVPSLLRRDYQSPIPLFVLNCFHCLYRQPSNGRRPQDPQSP